MSSDAPALRLQNISKIYQIYDAPHHRLLQMIYGHRRRFFREFWALRDLNFEVQAGESIGIIGRNGAGKSTLLQIIAGTLTPSIGSCETRGRVTALLELGSGFNPEFTGKENVRLNAAVLGLTDKEIDEKYEDIVAFADIGDFLNQPVKTYSSGMKMRLAFAVQAFIDPEILIIDEALSVGDGAFQIKCMKHMRGMLERQTTVLLVSHSLQTLRSFCSRIIWLDDGKLKMDGDTRDVTSRYSETIFSTAPNGRGKKTNTEKTKAAALADVRSFPVLPLEEVQRTESLRRWGTGEAQVAAFSFYAEEPGIVKSYEFGSTVTLNIEASIKTSLPEEAVALAFAIRNKQGLDIISVSTDRLHVFCDTPEAGTTLRARFSFALRVAPGDYSLILAVAYNEEGRRVYIDYVENAHYFSVLSDEPHYGVYEPEVQAEFL